MSKNISSQLPRAMIFDWDNTLVDSWEAIAEAMNHTRETYGLNVWTLDEIRANCTRAARESFPEWFGDNWKKAYDTYYKDFDEVRRRRDIKVLPGAQELLLWLQEQSIPSFVVSNKRGDYLRYEAEKLNWVGLFKSIVGAQDAPRDKPDRAHVDHALHQSGIIADESVWFIGDSETDVLCARNSNCTPVLIGHPDEALRLKVALNFADCQELQSLLYSTHNSRS
jgi:phosphoglycolate phosphatase